MEGGRLRIGRARLGAYFAALIVLFVLAGLAGALYVHVQSDRDAHTAGLHDATVAAQSAARLIGDGAIILQGALAGVSANPAEADDLLAHPSSCALTFAHIGAFPTGHLDIVRADGRIACSSASTVHTQTYASQPWFTASRGKPAALAPEADPLTGQPVAIFTAPFHRGVAVGMVSLRAVGPDLSAELAGSKGIEYVVTAPDGGTVLAESGNPARWTGARLAGPTRFGRASSPDRTGLDGHQRLFAAATVPGLGWQVHAGLRRSVAMASASRLFQSELVVVVVALLIVLAATVLVHRRIARPIVRLAFAIRGASGEDTAALHAVSGPAEVTALADSFRSLIGRLGNELTERQRAEDAAREAEQSTRAVAEAYRLLFENNPLPMWIYDARTLDIIEVNEAAVEQYGYTREEFASMTIKDLRPAEDLPALLASTGSAPPIERSGPWRHLKRDGSPIDVEISSHAVDFMGRPARFVMATDVSHRERLARQLAQTQRLESLGQLAGGVAHDFNNLLSVILNYALFVKEEIATSASTGDGPLVDAQADLEEIERAARRAASLTHQLLAFARREVIDPAAISLNDVVADTEQMLRRTLGEHIRLTRAPGEDSWPVIADSGQMVQVLVNLAVNARDAMPSGGELVIETDNVEVDETYASTRRGLVPGQYVRLRVSDNGEGMDSTTLERAFEPFFTTKPKGEGTGLGLATVYGIVTQSGGQVQLYSEPGIGTTCSIMLPATDQPAAPFPAPTSPERGASGEVVLLVEDEDGIREVARRILERRGYNVLAADNGPDAIELARHHDGPIDLLITDVIMPRMLGKEVAERILALRPDTRVMYMSGYAEPILGAGENVPKGMVLLEKPFTEHALLIKAHEALSAAQPAV